MNENLIQQLRGSLYCDQGTIDSYARKKTINNLITFFEKIDHDFSDGILDLKLSNMFISVTTKFFVIISVPEHIRLYRTITKSVILHNIEEDIINIAGPFIDKIYFEAL